MAKAKSIGPNVARILAEKIVAELNKDNKTHSQLADDLNKEVSEYPEVIQGKKLVNQLIEINKKIQQKVSKRLKSNYQKLNWFSITNEKNIVYSSYCMLDHKEIPSVDKIKDEIVLESAFSEAGSPEEIIAQYIKKYSTKTSKTK